MIELSDERLARRGAQGDQRAFEAIYRRYHQQLYRFCLALVGSPYDAQDTLQNTMVKVLRALPGETRRIELKPWLYRIARNESIETLRRRRDRVELEPEEAAPGAVPLAERAEDRDRLRRLFIDLEELPDRQRAALLMRELAGLSFEQIANALETTPATARQAVYEARLSLRQMEEGREMCCEAVMRALSEADGRSRRRRDLRAHLRACSACRAFAAEADRRRATLAALSPLPLAASSGILHGLLAGGGAGKALAGSALAKSASALAVAALVGVSVAGRVGLIDVPLAARDSRQHAASAPSAAASQAATDHALPGTARSLRAHVHGARQAAPPARHRAIGAGAPARAAHHPGAGAGGWTAAGAPSASPRTRAPAAERRGEAARGRAGIAKGPPQAAERGQQVAASHKPPPANPSPGDAGRGAAQSADAPRRAPSPPAEAPASPPEAEPAEPAPETPGGLPEQPHGLEQPASGNHGP